jgi:hypothetical protein
MTRSRLMIELRPAGEPGFVTHAKPNTCLHTGLQIPECSCSSCTRRMIRERFGEAPSEHGETPTAFGGGY